MVFRGAKIAPLYFFSIIYYIYEIINEYFLKGEIIMRELNIFTDASIITTIFGETIGCAGAICMENNNLCKFQVLRDSTNNISEITAVKLAIELALENRAKFDIVNIWADSQWSIFGLTKWIRSWMNNSYNGILYNSSGNRVKNQQIFLSIIKLISENNLRVNFYHIKGHVSVNDIKSINHAISVFNKSNGCSISREKIFIAVNMNNMIDTQTRNILANYKTEPRVQLKQGIINPIIPNEILIRYYNLVTLGGKSI